MNELQKLARAAHDVFVADCIDKMEASAKEGNFTESFSGTAGQIKALKFYLDEQELRNEIAEQIADTAVVFINWGPLR